MPKIQARFINAQTQQQLQQNTGSPLLARLFAARGVQADETHLQLTRLLPPDGLRNITQMATLLVQAIDAQKKLLVIGDYDADGATATALAVKGLRLFGAKIDFLVPNRFEYGYGLTPEIVQLAAQRKPDILMTVDNGIASVDGVAAANAMGLKVLITDHHLPAEQLPNAACIVNPNQPDCSFASKHLAGVGVMFYILLALRSAMRQRGEYAHKTEPNLAELLDLVALGTVADLVKLDFNNRILVEHGLRRIRAGASSAGILAILKVANRDGLSTNTQDLAFYAGPRLNAAGRMDDMTIGIQCLLAESPAQAEQLAQQLHSLNTERREIESEMQQEAWADCEALAVENGYTVSLYQPHWHEGVVGILASRLKNKLHRPSIVFAQAGEGLLKGSGRSIAHFHLRDALDLVSKQQPNLIQKFGGHAMAAGLTILEKDFSAFKMAFETVAKHWLSVEDLEQMILTDGVLAQAEMTLENAQLLQQQVWGQGFEPPQFEDEFTVLNQSLIQDKHLKLTLLKCPNSPADLQNASAPVSAIFFGQAEFLGEKIRAVYELQSNVFRGQASLQLNIRFAENLAFENR